MWERFSTYWFNKVCFIIHLFFGVWLAIESVAEINVGGYSTKLDLVYVRLNGSDWPKRTYHVENVSNFNIVGALASFSLITAFTHLAYMSSFEKDWPEFFIGVLNPLNTGSIKSEDSKPYSIDYRYFEYAITAPIMILIITVLFGIRDLYTLIAIFALMHVTMLFGVLQSWNENSVWPHFFGWIPYAFAWTIIAMNFSMIVRDNANVPDFVWAVLGIEIVLFSAFGFVQMYYDVWPKLKGYSAIESNRSLDGLNNMLSLLSKVLLTTILYGNFVSLEQFDD